MSHLRTLLFGTAHVDRGRIVWRMPLRASIVVALLLVAFLAAGRQLEAVPVVVGALFAAIADVGEHVGHRWRTMLWTTAWLMAMTAIGVAISDWRALTVIVSCAIAAACGLVGAIGTRAALIGTLSLVILTIFAGTPQVPWELVTSALLIGLGGIVQTAVTCVPPLLRNPALVHKPQDDGQVLVRLRPHLRADDPFLRHAARLALAIGIATILAGAWHHAHAYWIPMTVAWVAKPDQQGTVSRVIARLAGTLLGMILIGVLIERLAWGPAGLVLAVTAGSMVALSFIWANYAIAVAGITVLVIALFTPVVGGGTQAIWDRGIDTVLAGVITVLVSFAWRAPRSD